MRVLAFVILHSGRPYLRAAVESIIDQVDRVIFLYSPTPSQGFQANIPCPDTQEELAEEIRQGAGAHRDKVEFYRGEWANETEHINEIWQHTEGFDWVWRFDADEVSPPGMIAEMIRQAKQTNADVLRVPFVHFWRSFSRACRDGSHPIRLFRRIGCVPWSSERTLDSKGGKWEVLHFGYAQPTRYIEYKMLVSGHRPEWRADWLKDRWLANAQADVHPVIFPTHWMPTDYDKTTLPDALKRHPYFGMDVIE